MVKKIINFFMIGAFLMEIAGCGKMISHEELALDLLKRKYNDEFVIQEVQSQSLIKGFYTVIAYQKDNPDLLFKADVDSGGEGIGDTYVSRILCDKLADKAAANLDNLPGYYYIHTVVSLSPYFLDDPDISLEDFMKESPKNTFTFHVHYVPDNTDSEQFYNTLTDMFKGMELINGKVHLYIADEAQLKDVQEYVENHDRCYDNFERMTDSYSVGIYDVRQGIIVTPKEEIMKSLEGRL